MAIDSRYIATLSLQEYLVQKGTGLPLSNGTVNFFSVTTGLRKSVYQLSGNPPDYGFVPLPNPIVLSAAGTIQDNNGNDVIPYYLPYEIDSNGNITSTSELYYVTVYDSNGALQFTRSGWPPNAEEQAQAQTGNLFNYIPNGQFLLHNTINPADNNVLSAGKTAIAPGGWQFVLPNSTSSVNSLIFNQIQDWTDNPPESPPYEVNVICSSPSGSDIIKSLRIYFNNVNKFANGSDYTFFFSGAALTNSADISINLIKNFGESGSAEITIPITNFTITNEQLNYSAVVNFQTNSGETIGSGNFCAIDIAFNVNQAFSLVFTDFMLLSGNVIVSDYVVQTDADTISRSLFGWCNIPDYTGNDLYLMPVVTPSGMQFDHSVIGRIEAYPGNVTSPDSTSPLPIGNIMPANGSSYLFDNFSTLDIPYSRLGNYFIANSAVSGMPMYGTGPSFVNAYTALGATNDVRVAVNSAGTGIGYVTDGSVPTNFTFTGMVQYGTSETGSNSFGYKAYNNVAHTILCVGDFTTPENPFNAQTSGFTITLLDIYQGLLAQQPNSYAFTVLTVAASALVNTGATAKFWEFSNSTTDYYMWFFFTNEDDPAPVGRTGIKVTLQPTFTAQDVANIIREVMNAYQITNISIPTTPGGTPTAGSYFLMSSLNSGVVNYLVWYEVNGLGTEPIVSGRIPIKVSILNSDSNATIATKTAAAINSYQYFVPNLAGMFPRGYDFNGIYDLDVAQRWSTVSGISGAVFGTFEWQQLLSHQHIGSAFIDGGSSEDELAGFGNPIAPIELTGGTETRPVNFGVTWAFRY